MGNAVTIHLIRHAKTRANRERKYIGHTDEPIESLEKVAIALQPTIIYGSDLKRCRQTAAHYFPQIPYQPYSELRELHFGDFEMKTYEELKDHQHYQQWIQNPLQVTPPNGESFADFTVRVQRALEQIVVQSGAYLFIVHGGVIRFLLSLFTAQPFHHVQAEHATIYSCTWSQFSAWKEGRVCTSISEVPITASANL